jgi:cytidylate kinase
MKRITGILLIIFFIAIYMPAATAQCSVCTKSVQQLGERPAKALNTGILYLMFTPFLIVGVIGYRWWKSNKRFEEEEKESMGNG